MEEQPQRIVVPRTDSGYGAAPQQPRPSAPAPGGNGPKFGVTGIVGIIVVLIILIVGGLALGKAGPFAPKSVWSAVFLGDNEVFFGHIKDISGSEIDLTNVYYLQKTTAPAGQNTTGQSTSLSITGLVANQIQCPKDFLSINRNAVLYWQDLQDSSYVVQRLNQLTNQTQTCFQPSAASPSAAPQSSAPAQSSAAATPTPAASATP